MQEEFLKNHPEIDADHFKDKNIKWSAQEFSLNFKINLYLQ